MRFALSRPVSSERGTHPRWPGGPNGLPSLVLIALLAACGGAAGGDENASQPDGVSTTAGEAGQETPDAPRFGPDGQLIRTVRVTVGGVGITVEIADTDALRQRGLMDRDSLPENHGMLFVYPDEQPRSFWMRNTRIPLDIAFFDRNLSIVNIERMEPQTDENTYSAAPVQYALEMVAGWFEANGIGPGDKLEF